MSFFDDVLDKIFPKKGANPSELIHETLERSTAETAAFAQWQVSESSQDLIKEVENAYYLKKSGIDSKLGMHILTTDYANGFAVTYNADIAQKDFKFLFDFLREQTLKLNYRLSQKDRRVIDRGTYLETIEKWYLKPPRNKMQNGLSSQLYGNILIEHIEIDGQPSHLKLMANIYQDRLYTKALSFDEFISEILTRN